MNNIDSESDILPSVISEEILNDPKQMAQYFSQMPESYWWEKGAENAFSIFSKALRDVPAYSKFLKQHNVDPVTIKTIDDFLRLPVFTKENYLRAYPLNEVALRGSFSDKYLITKSSGSSGIPFYWPRYKEQDRFEAALTELVYDQIGIDNKSTLIIVAVALGTWVAGSMMMTTSLEIAKKRGRDISVITPGANNKEILEIVRDLGELYDQVLIIAYPPSARSIVMEGVDSGLDWRRYKPKFFLGGESVSQEWKEFILKQIGSDRLMDIMVIFGMAELNLLSFETPIAVLIRKIIASDINLKHRLFGNTSLSALMQYNPVSRWIESVDGSIVMSAYGGIPLVRYCAGDMGGVFRYSELVLSIKEAGYDVDQLLKEAGYDPSNVWKWPFFYSFGREGSISLMGANIYPANMERFCHEHSDLNDYMITVNHDELQQPSLCIYLELRNGKEYDVEETQSFQLSSSQEILRLLLENNIDFLDAYHEEPSVMTPVVTLYNYKTGPFATRKMKQKHIFVRNS